MHKIIVKNKKYNDENIIADIQITLAKNAHIAIIGPSGCGKTTLLNILAGLDDDNYQARLPAAKLAYIFQENRLLPWLTVTENILLVAPKQKDACTKLLQQLGLSNVANSYPETLSGGMQKRVSIARAFIVQPDFLLLDEPFVSLDVPTADACREALIELANLHQTSVILVSHDLDEALQLADTIYFLSNKPAKIIHTLHVKNATKPLSKQAVLIQYPQILTGQIN